MPCRDSTWSVISPVGPILGFDFIRATANYRIGRGASLSVLRKIKTVLHESNIYFLPRISKLSAHLFVRTSIQN
jgi:hypothetical protein